MEQETVPAAFASTAHRHRPVTAVRELGRATSWLRLNQEVRALALGLAAEHHAGPGRRISVHGPDGADRLALELAVLASGAVAVLDGADSDEDVYAHGLDRLRAAGQTRDEEQPDAFERAWQALGPDDPAIVADGAEFTHADVLTGARSLVQAVAVDAGDVVRCSLSIDGAAGWVVGHLVPVLTAATLLVGRSGDATVVVSEDPADLRLGPAVQERRFGRRRLTDPGPRTVLVVGCNATTFPGLAGIATGPDGPLPGVTIGVDDGGEVLVRSDAVPRSRCDDGWLRTGRTGELDRTLTLT